MAQKLISPINKGKLNASWKTDAYKSQFNMVHYGIDVVSSAGSATLYACGDGEVLATGADSVLGYFMILKYYDAYNHVTKKSCDVICRMWHLGSIAVKKGDKVNIDTKIANYGNTGQYTTGAHLHLEMDTDTRPQYVNWTPTLTGNTANFTGSNSGANDKTMTNPLEWFHLKTTAPENQTWTTANDKYIRAEDKSLPLWTSEQVNTPSTPTPSTGNIEGIDVSKHNGVVDWAKVKAAGKKFVFIRIGWAGFQGGIKVNNALDTRFHENMKGAIAAGLDVGVYLYSYCKNVEAAKIAALETLDIVKPYKLSYPIAFDIESESQSEPGGAQYDKMPKATNTAICNAFLNVIKDHGYTGILYTYKSFAESYLNMTDLSKWDLWVAQYAAACGYKGAYTIWQHHGDVKGFVGSCPGVTGACDLNTSYKDYAAVINNPNIDINALKAEIEHWKNKNANAQQEIEYWKKQAAAAEAEAKAMKQDISNLNNKYK